MFLNAIEDLLLLLAALVGTLGVFFLIDRCWPAPARMRHNDIIGWQINILGTVYAIVLGFMLYTTWNDFQQAQQNTASEATALLNLARIARGLPQPQSADLLRETRDYADAVVTLDWPAMQDGHLSSQSRTDIEQIWNSLVSTAPVSEAQKAALAQAWNEVSALSAHRRQRRVETTARLPAILWVVLDAGGALLLICCCLFGSQHVRLHLFLVLGLGFLVALLLLTIAGIDRPFQGWLHVPVQAFQGVADTLTLDQP